MNLKKSQGEILKNANEVKKKHGKTLLGFRPDWKKPAMPRQEIPEKLARIIQRDREAHRRDSFTGVCATSRGTDDLIELNIGKIFAAARKRSDAEWTPAYRNILERV